MRMLFAFLSLCISCSAQAIPEKYSIFFYGPGKVNQGQLTIGDETQPGLFQITSGSANVGLCPPDKFDGEQIHDCKVVLGGIGDYLGNAYFRPDSLELFTDSFGEWVPGIVMQTGHVGHAYMQMLYGPYGGYDGHYSVWSNNPSSGWYKIVEFGEERPIIVPEPTAGALLAVPALALWAVRRRRH